MNTSINSKSSKEMLIYKSKMQSIIGIVGILVSILAIVFLISSGQIKESDGFFSLSFLGAFFALSAYLYLSNPKIKINQHVISRESMFARYQMGWDEVERIQTDEGKQLFILCNNSQETPKRMPLPNTQLWGKNKTPFVTLIEQQVKQRGISLEINANVVFVKLQNVKIDKDAPAPETYISKQPQFSGEYVEPISIQPKPLPAPQSTGHVAVSVIAGFIAAIVGAAVWAGVSYATNYQIGYLAIGIGALVGYVIQRVAQGGNAWTGFISAGLSLFGCVLGNLLFIAAYFANQESVSFFYTLIGFLLTPSVVVEVLVATFSPMDLLFYGLAAYSGYRVSLGKKV